MIQRFRRTPYGENVYLLDGERLDSLNKWATFQSDQEIRRRLLGLRNQLFINIKIWNSVKEDAEEGKIGEGRGSFLFGIEGFLSSSIMPEWIPEEEVMQLWQRARIIDSICSRYLLRAAKEKIKKKDMESLVRMLEEAISYALKLISGIDGAISELKPL